MDLPTSIDDINKLCEDERCELKSARTTFDFAKLADYCAALANEGGGVLVLGVTDGKPRKASGTTAFRALQKTVADVTQQLRIKIRGRETHIDGKRVVMLEVPPHPLGMPLAHNGRYMMRGGEGLVPMTPDQLRRIFDEGVSDFSATPAGAATLADLSDDGIAALRQLWARKSGNDGIKRLSANQCLEDLGLIVDGRPTIAAIVLVGSVEATTRYVPQAELIFEYRSTPTHLEYLHRIEFKGGFLLWHDRLWDAVNARNDVHRIQEGLLARELPMFAESVVREAILNAVAHREYRLSGSIFVRQAPDVLEIVNPGGLPEGITVENMLWRQDPRNRRLAEVLQQCGLIERSGQGVRRMFESCIRQSKPRPDYSRTDDHQVSVVLRGDVRNPDFLRFLERVGEERLKLFSTRDFLALDLVDKEERLPADLKDAARELKEAGVLESVGRGRGTRYILSRRYYTFTDTRGAYTRRRGLDQETNKQLLLQHLEGCPDGCPLSELHEVLPGLSTDQVQYLLRLLRLEGRAEVQGRTRAARWHLVREVKREPDSVR